MYRPPTPKENDVMVSKKRFSSLSPSGIVTWAKCPMAFYYQYVEWLKGRPTAKMVLGSALDVAKNMVLFPRAKGESEPGDSEVMNKCIEYYVGRERQEKLIYDKDPAFYRVLLVDCLKVLMDDYLPYVSPIDVEKSIYVKNEGRIALSMRPDIIERGNKIVDLKTSGRMPNLNNTVQPQAYVFGEEWETGVRKEFEYAVIYYGALKSKGVELRIMPVDVTDKMIDEFFEIFDSTAKAVEAALKTGVFPRSYLSWACSPHNCGHYYICRGKDEQEEAVEDSMATAA